MNLILTGSSGFIGHHFLKKTKEYTIIPISLKNTPVDHINFNNVDTILHLAGLAHQMNGAPEKEYFRINSDLTIEFATKAKEKGVKHFIFISTAKVYGESTKIGHPFNERSPCFPTDPYSKSKLQAEERLKILEDDNFTISIIRIPLVYGAGVKGNLKSLINLIRKTPLLPLGKINNKRSLLYVGTLIDFLKTVIEKKKSGIFIACDNTALSSTQLIRLLADSLNKKIILFKMPFFIKKSIELFKPAIIERLYDSFELDNTVTNQLLEFSPKYSIEEGVKETTDYYKDNKLNKPL
jgi:nucleoside-diphosphate-sugar epimerase